MDITAKECEIKGKCQKYFKRGAIACLTCQYEGVPIPDDEEFEDDDDNEEYEDENEVEDEDETETETENHEFEVEVEFRKTVTGSMRYTVWAPDEEAARDQALELADEDADCGCVEYAVDVDGGDESIDVIATRQLR